MTEQRERPDHTHAHEHAAPMRAARGGPLADIKVIDFTQALAGPYCTMMLADMGADVIKIEPAKGDGPRLLGPHTELDDEHHFGGYFASINRNKRSVVLDISVEADRVKLLAMIDEADIVVENFRAGVMDRNSMSYETLRARNPKLVYGAIRGFGDPRTGQSPYSDWPAYDVVAQAMGGVISYTGSPGNLVSAGPSIGDLYPATMLVAGILGALHHAQRTGEGQFVDVAMTDALMALSESLIWRYSYTGEIQAPRGTRHPSLCPFEVYKTATGGIAIAAPGEGHWAALCGVIGRDDLVSDDRTRSSRRRVENREMVREVIEEWTTKRTQQEVVDALAGKVPVGPVLDAPALFASEHVRAREMLVAVEHPGSSRPVVTPNTPIRFTATPGGVYRRAPILGEHTAEVLAEFGLVTVDPISKS